MDIYEGTTTDQFIDFYNMEVEVVFEKDNVEYEGVILENSVVSIKTVDGTFVTTIKELKDIPIQTFAYNGTNYSMPLNKANLLNYVSCSWGCYSGHKGIDFAWSGISGTTIYDVERGTVYSRNDSCATYSGSTSSTCGSGWGNYVSISHPDGTRTLYAHMQKGSVRHSLNAGVSKSTSIGQVGSSGVSSGYHLHFEVYVSGSRVNPYNYLVGAPLPSGGDQCYLVGNIWVCPMFIPIVTE